MKYSKLLNEIEKQNILLETLRSFHSLTAMHIYEINEEEEKLHKLLTLLNYENSDEGKTK